MSGTGFYGSSDPTNGIKELNEDMMDKASIPSGLPYCVNLQ